MQALAQKAYGEVRNRTADSRSIERALFRQITDAMIEAQDLKQSDPAKWANAINRNLDLWTLLASDLMNPDNGLDAGLRKSLLELSVFVRRSSTKILAGADELPDLIDINESIIKGLANAEQG
ncbi:MAG: flagellar biosynthesis regulator FlaF [Pseudomonadota bacterium]